MTDIVLRGLTQKEVYDLRLLKAKLDEPNWRKLVLRIVKEWSKKPIAITEVLE